jgi:hypothetical protein
MISIVPVSTIYCMYKEARHLISFATVGTGNISVCPVGIPKQ